MQIKLNLYIKSRRKTKNLSGQKTQYSFEELKQALTQAPILAYPTREGFFILDTDASNVGMGAVLSPSTRWIRKSCLLF
jgi:hypothetical protein